MLGQFREGLFTKVWSWKEPPAVVTVCVCVCESLDYIRLFAVPWTAAHQAPLSMDFSRQEYWRGLPFPSLGDLPDPGIKHSSPTLQADSLPSEPLGKPTVTV